MDKHVGHTHVIEHGCHIILIIYLKLYIKLPFCLLFCNMSTVKSSVSIFWWIGDKVNACVYMYIYIRILFIHHIFKGCIHINNPFEFPVMGKISQVVKPTKLVTSFAAGSKTTWIFFIKVISHCFYKFITCIASVKLIDILEITHITGY